MGLATPARCLSNSGLQRCSIATLNGLLVAYPDKLPQELALRPCRRKSGETWERMRFSPRK
jgi:poly(3-hydroxybutyrate) depolymerase